MDVAGAAATRLVGGTEGRTFEGEGAAASLASTLSRDGRVEDAAAGARSAGAGVMSTHGDGEMMNNEYSIAATRTVMLSKIAIQGDHAAATDGLAEALLRMGDG